MPGSSGSEDGSQQHASRRQSHNQRHNKARRDRNRRLLKQAKSENWARQQSQIPAQHGKDFEMGQEDRERYQPPLGVKNTNNFPIVQNVQPNNVAETDPYPPLESPLQDLRLRLEGLLAQQDQLSLEATSDMSLNAEISFFQSALQSNDDETAYRGPRSNGLTGFISTTTQHRSPDQVEAQEPLSSTTDDSSAPFLVTHYAHELGKYRAITTAVRKLLEKDEEHDNRLVREAPGAWRVEKARPDRPTMDMKQFCLDLIQRARVDGASRLWNETDENLRR